MSEQRIENKAEEAERIDLIRFLGDFFRVFRRTWIWVLILTVAGGAFFYFRDYRSWSPVYTASATFTVRLNNGVGTSGTNTYYENTTAEQMAKTFPYILTSGVLQRKVAAQMGTGGFSGSVRATVEENTNLFTLSVTDSDPQRAYDTLNAVITYYPEVAEAIVGRTSLDMLDESGVPGAPDYPRDSMRPARKGAAAGLALGLVWTVVRAVNRKTVRRRGDIPRYMHVRCLGEIPRVHFKKRSRGNEKVLNITNKKTDENFLESIPMLRNKVEYSAQKHHHKVVLVTSALAGEGKSTVAVNLAISLAQSGKKTALVDCDLRHPSCRKILGQEQGMGLRELLEKKTEIKEVFLNRKDLNIEEDIPFFAILGGKPVNDGSRLLGSREMESLIRALKNSVDYMILDSAPAGLLTDAGVLAQYADTAVCVVRRDYARADTIMEGIEALAEAHVRVSGGVLNQI